MRIVACAFSTHAEPRTPQISVRDRNFRVPGRCAAPGLVLRGLARILARDRQAFVAPRVERSSQIEVNHLALGSAWRGHDRSAEE
jgi:hypothetical protein